ncbi:DNA-binding transcription factor yap1 [Rhodotorula kratochvilovae]
MDSWAAPDFLANQAGEDYLASLASFLDGKGDISVNTLLQPQLAQGALSASNEPSSPELTSDSASPASSDGLNSAVTSAPAPLTATRGRRSSPMRVPAGTTAPHDKRKTSATAAGAVKDRKSAGAAAGHHSHPTGEDGELARSESPEDEARDGKGGKTKTSERRRAQNRQAQRNFRERKEKHLKDLEERVLTLEERTKQQDAENSALKQLLENLQNENERLKTYDSSFTFDYNKDVSGSNAMPQASTFKPPSPPVSQDGIDDANNSFKFDTSSILGASTSSLSGAPLFAAAPAYSPPSGSGAAPVLAGLDDSLFLGAFTASPGSNLASATSLNLPTPPVPSAGSTADLFTAYRDPLAELGTQAPALSTFSDFDALFASTSSAAVSTAPTSPEDPLAAYLNMSPSPLSAAGVPSPGAFFTGGLAPKHEVSPQMLAAMEQACPLKHGEKYEFDVDGLCSEMKLKATCQEAARQALKSAMAEDAAASRKAYPSQL